MKLLNTTLGLGMLGKQNLFKTCVIKPGINIENKETKPRLSLSKNKNTMNKAAKTPSPK